MFPTQVVVTNIWPYQTTALYSHIYKTHEQNVKEYKSKLQQLIIENNL